MKSITFLCAAASVCAIQSADAVTSSDFHLLEMDQGGWQGGNFDGAGFGSYEKLVSQSVSEYSHGDSHGGESSQDSSAVIRLVGPSTPGYYYLVPVTLKATFSWSLQGDGGAGGNAWGRALASIDASGGFMNVGPDNHAYSFASLVLEFPDKNFLTADTGEYKGKEWNTSSESMIDFSPPDGGLYMRANSEFDMAEMEATAKAYSYAPYGASATGNATSSLDFIISIDRSRNVIAVPEVGSVGLMGTGLACLLGLSVARRRRRSDAS